MPSRTLKKGYNQIICIEITDEMIKKSSQTDCQQGYSKRCGIYHKFFNMKYRYDTNFKNVPLKLLIKLRN